MSQRKRATTANEPIARALRQRTTRSGPASVSAHECRVYRFDCKDVNDRMMVDFLQDVAAGQKPAFVDVFPWEAMCDEKTIMFVSLSMPSLVTANVTMRELRATKPTVCGWLTATYSGRPQDGAFVSKLSTQAATDRAFGGVGTQLLRAVEAIGADFIYLYPLDTAIAFYKKAGYKKIDIPNVKHMFKIVAKDKKVRLPRLQSVASSLDEVGQFKKEAKDLLNDNDYYRRLVDMIAEDGEKAYVAKEYLKDPESLRDWIDGKLKGGRSVRRGGRPLKARAR